MMPVNERTFEYQLQQLESQSEGQYAKTKFEIIMAWLSGSPPLRILNVGCGLGELSLMMAHAGHDVVGIDLEEDFIGLARRAAAREGLASCRFEACALESYRTDEPFDLVAATDVIEHIEDDRAAMAQIAALVKAGGQIVIAVPAGQWLFGFHDRSLGHYRRYSARSLRDLAASCCHVDAVRYFGMTLVPVALLYSRILQRGYPLAASSDRTGHPWLSAAVSALLGFERRWQMPLGTSLLLRGHRVRETMTRPT